MRVRASPAGDHWLCGTRPCGRVGGRPKAMDEKKVQITLRLWQDCCLRDLRNFECVESDSLQEFEITQGSVKGRTDSKRSGLLSENWKKLLRSEAVHGNCEVWEVWQFER